MPNSVMHDYVSQLRPALHQLEDWAYPDEIDHALYRPAGRPAAEHRRRDSGSAEWYRTPNYRRRLVRSPRQVLAEFGLYLPADVEIRVEDSNSKHRFLVLPVRPDGTGGWSEDQLAEIVTRDCLIGVALPKPGATWNVVGAEHPAVRPVARP